MNYSKILGKLVVRQFIINLVSFVLEYMDTCLLPVMVHSEAEQKVIDKRNGKVGLK